MYLENTQMKWIILVCVYKIRMQKKLAALRFMQMKPKKYEELQT